MMWVTSAIALTAWAQPSPQLQQTRQTASGIVTLANGNAMLDFGRDAFAQIEITADAPSDNDTLLIAYDFFVVVAVNVSLSITSPISRL